MIINKYNIVAYLGYRILLICNEAANSLAKVTIGYLNYVDLDHLAILLCSLLIG